MKSDAQCSICKSIAEAIDDRLSTGKPCPQTQPGPVILGEFSELVQNRDCEFCHFLQRKLDAIGTGRDARPYSGAGTSRSIQVQRWSFGPQEQEEVPPRDVPSIQYTALSYVCGRLPDVLETRREI